MRAPELEPLVFMAVERDGDGYRLTFTRAPLAAKPGTQVRMRGMLTPDPFIVQVPALIQPLTRVEFNIVLPDAYVLGLLSGADQKRLACAGLKTTDTLIIQPTAILPAGYGGLTVACTENGWARIGFVRPTLAIGANHSIPLRITALR